MVRLSVACFTTLLTVFIFAVLVLVKKLLQVFFFHTIAFGLHTAK